MKKIIGLLLITLLIVGCNTKQKDKEPIEEKNKTLDQTSEEAKTMKKQLIEYGQLVTSGSSWHDGTAYSGETTTYNFNLTWLEETGMYDVSLFVNPVSKKPCNKSKTMIQFIIEEINGEPKGTLNPILVCDE